MTGRTHDLTAFTALVVYGYFMPLISMSLATFVVVIAANFVGGLFPDIDQPGAALWRRLRGGKLIGNLISPLLGGHRLITHSLLGLGLTAFLLKHVLNILHSVLLVDMNVVWWAFMIGMVSHLLADMLTREGVPLLFPIPLKFGLPPFKSMRPETGGFFEKLIFFPGLVILNIYLFYLSYERFLDFFQHYLKFK